jgi:hypothetical protein
MPHLHLPIDHTEADLVLAANLAEVVGSEDLYVAWSYEGGPGVIPEVEAVLVDHHPRGFFAALAAGFGAFWRALTGRPSTAAQSDDVAIDPAKRPAERPYAD